MEDLNCDNKRPSVRTILSKDFWNDQNGNDSLSLKDYGRIAQNIGLLSIATILTGNAAFFFPFLMSASTSVASKIGMNSKGKIDRTFKVKYEILVLYGYKGSMQSVWT